MIKVLCRFYAVPCIKLHKAYERITHKHTPECYGVKYISQKGALLGKDSGIKSVEDAQRVAEH